MSSACSYSRLFEIEKKKSMQKKRRSLFMAAYIYNIYIYIYVCVCVCVCEGNRNTQFSYRTNERLFQAIFAE